MQIILTRWQLAGDAGRRWQPTARPPTSSSWQVWNEADDVISSGVPWRRSRRINITARRSEVGEFRF